MQRPFSNDIHLREQEAELDALTVIVYANANDCLEAFGLAPSIIVTSAKGETIVINGGDLFNKKTWKTFLKETEQTTDIYQLAGTVELLAKQYAEWILTKYTPRYRAISAAHDLAWLGRVAVLVVKRRILEQKYDAYLKGQRATFANPMLIAHMAVITAYHHMIKESARIAHHVIKDVAQAQELLQQLSEIYRHLAPEIQMHAGQVLALPPISPSHHEETRQEERAQDE